MSNDNTTDESLAGGSVLPSSWVGCKDLARRQYEQGNFEAALASYTAALRPELNCPASEQPVLLSNMVACRLKLGGTAHARAAVEHAKQCVAMNPSWSKGHVRLASAYISLGSEHSNDACNALQRALQLDPGNSMARDMLVRELRRDRVRTTTAGADSGNTTTSGNDSERPPPFNPEATSAGSFASRHSPPRQQSPPRYDDMDVDPTTVDDSYSLWERVQFYIARCTHWYHSQDDTVKIALKVSAVLLVLYVGFGGRFGMEATRPKGNYGSNNVYDQYRRTGTTESAYPYQETARSSRSNSNNHQRRTSSYDNDDDRYTYSSRSNRGSYGGSWYGGGSDMQIISMVLMMGLAYAGGRWFGLSPWQMMMMMNVANRAGRRGYGGGMGMGYGGMGHRRRMPRPRW